MNRHTIKGKIKEIVDRITGNKSQETKGKIDKASGNFQEGIGKLMTGRIILAESREVSTNLMLLTIVQDCRMRGIGPETGR